MNTLHAAAAGHTLVPRVGGVSFQFERPRDPAEPSLHVVERIHDKVGLPLSRAARTSSSIRSHVPALSRARGTSLPTLTTAAAMAKFEAKRGWWERGFWRKLGIGFEGFTNEVTFGLPNWIHRSMGRMSAAEEEWLKSQPEYNMGEEFGVEAGALIPIGRLKLLKGGKWLRRNVAGWIHAGGSKLRSRDPALRR